MIWYVASLDSKCCPLALALALALDIGGDKTKHIMIRIIDLFHTDWWYFVDFC
jgi:hypothetical protein